MKKDSLTFSVRLNGKQARKLGQLALLSRRTKQSVLRILIEDANLNDVTRMLTEAERPQEQEPAR